MYGESVNGSGSVGFGGLSHQSLADMATEGKDVEKLVLSQALKLVFNDRVFIHGNRSIVL